MNNGVMIEICDGPQRGTCFQLLQPVVTIGRAAGCDVVVEHESLSRQHVKLSVLPDGIRLEDQNSQNGTYVNGERISEALVPIGMSFRVGGVTLRVISDSGASNQLSTSSGSIRGVASAKENRGMNLGQLNADNNDAVTFFDQTRGNNSSLLWAVLIVAIFAGGIYLMQSLETSRMVDTSFKIVKARQQQVMMFPHAFGSFQAVGTSSGQNVIEVQRYSGILADNLTALSKSGRTPPQEFLVVTGNVEGDADIDLLDSSGGVIDQYRIVVRGLTPRLWPEDIPAHEAKDLADQYVREAKVLESDGFRYDAAQRYKNAELLYRNHAGDLDHAQSILLERKRMETQLAKDLRKVFDDAMASAYPVIASQNQRDSRTAFLLLSEGKLLVPDPECLEWQILDLWQAELRRRMR